MGCAESNVVVPGASGPAGSAPVESAPKYEEQYAAEVADNDRRQLTIGSRYGTLQIVKMDLKTPRGWRRMKFEEAKNCPKDLDYLLFDKCVVGFDRGAFDWKGNYIESVKPGEVTYKIIIRFGKPDPNKLWPNLPKPKEPEPEIILVPKPKRVIPPEEAEKYATEVPDNDKRQLTIGSLYGTLQIVKMDLKTPRGWRRMKFEEAKNCPKDLDELLFDQCVVGFDRGAFDWKGNYIESVKPGYVTEKIIIRVGQPNPNVSSVPEYIRIDAKTGKYIPDPKK